MSEWKKPSKPGNVPLNRPMPASNDENFNWKLWQTMKTVYGKEGPVLIDEIQSAIIRYETLYKLLPIEIDKRINFNTLGIILGYKYYLDQNKNYINFIKQNNKFLKNIELSGGLEAIALVRYIDYFIKSK